MKSKSKRRADRQIFTNSKENEKEQKSNSRDFCLFIEQVLLVLFILENYIATGINTLSPPPSFFVVVLPKVAI